MADKKKIVELNQTAQRVTQILDQTDSILKVVDDAGNETGNANKFWTTSAEGVLTAKKISDSAEYGELLQKTNEAQSAASNATGEIVRIDEDIDTLEKRIGEIEANMDMIASKINITRITSATVTRLSTDPGTIDYIFESLDSSGASTGKATVTWRRGGVTGVILKTETIEQGENSFKLSGQIKPGDNTITATFVDSLGTSRSINWMITVVEMELTSTFDDSKIYDITESNSIEINYIAKGSIEKTIHFILNGEEIHTQEIGTTNNQQVYKLATQPHGAHDLEIYASATVGGEEVQSNHKYFSIMFLNPEDNTPIIRWVYDGKDIKQYKSTIFDYSVYTPGLETSKVELISYDENNIEETKTALTINSAKKEWVYKPQTTGKKTLTIKTGETSVSKEVNVIDLGITIDPVVSTLQLDFNPTGKSNNDEDYNKYEYVGMGNIKTTMTVSDNFDWYNGGWKTDDDGNSYFCIKAGDRMTLDYPLFKDGYDAKISGKDFKLIYKATNCREFKAPVMKCLEETGVFHTVVTIQEVKEFKKDEEGNDTEEFEIVEVTTTTFYVNGLDENDLPPSFELLDSGTTEEIDPETGLKTTRTFTKDISYIGVDINAQDAVLYAQTSKLEAVYCEDELMALEFNIESQNTKDELYKQTILSYIDADPIQGTTYGNTARFVHSKSNPVVFGSDTCDVHIYRFKVWSQHMNDTEMMNNHIADSIDADTMVERYERNDILDTNGNLDYEKIAALYPDLRIILIECDRFTNDKNDKVEGCKVQQIMGNGSEKHNWVANNVRIKGQGTSSNEYGTSARNIDLKFNKYTKDGVYKTGDDGNPIQDKNEDGTPKVDENGNPVYVLKEIAFEFNDQTYDTKYSMTDKSIGVNYINVKVNVASSENANNSQLAERFHHFNPYIRPAREADPRVRDTMEFHPCVIFIKETGSLPQEFPVDGEYHFYACGDFGNSKKNAEAFGMDEKNLKECIVEISNNTFPTCRFKRPEGWSEMIPAGFDVNTNLLTDYADYWDGDAIEFRYPEDLYAAAVNKKNEWDEDEIADARARLAVLQPAVQRLWSWVESTDTTIATNEDLPEVVKYDSVEYTKDTVEYRQAKFLAEYQDYFQKDSLLFHYLFTDRYLMIDNRAKNVFIHTSDGLLWDFCFNYDDDTALGCDNRGNLKFDYYLEDVDYIGGTAVYNAQDSVLWNNVRILLKKDLEEAFSAASRDNISAWSATDLLNQFNNYQWQKPERLHLFDMTRKYIRPYKQGHYRTNLNKDSSGKTIVSQGQYLPMLNGRKTLQRKRFEKYREMYCNSKYFHTDIKKDLLTFRCTAPEYANPDVENPSTVTWGKYFDITPYCDMYLLMDYDEILSEKVRAKAGQTQRIYTPEGKFDDKNVRVYGASMISSVGDLAPFYIKNPDFASAIRLSSLKIGDAAADYKSSVDFISLALGSNALLEYIDLRGCQSYVSELNLSGCSGLKEVYTTGSGVTGISFADGCLLEKAELNAVESIYAHDLKNLSSISLSAYNRLTSLNVENTRLLTSVDFLKLCTNATTLRLVGVNWDLGTDNEFLNKYLNNTKYDGYEQDGSTIDYPHISGSAYIDIVKEAELEEYNNIWPTLSVDYGQLIPQYKAIYLDWDGKTELYVDYVTLGEYPIDPVEQGKISAPTRPSTTSTVYTFDGWDGDFDLPMASTRTFIAKYSEKPMTYKVTWWKDRVNGTKLHEQEYSYGDEAIYVDTENHLAPRYESQLFSYYLFKGWDLYTGFVTEDMNVVAQWEQGYVPGESYPEDSKDWTAAQIYTVAQKNEALQYFGEATNDGPISNFDRVKIKMGANLDFPNLEKINIITEPKTFAGEAPIETEYALMDDINKSWTLFVDLRFINAAANETMVSCYSEETTSGFKIVNSSQNYPFIKYGSVADETSVKEGGSGRNVTEVNSNGAHLREVFVIVHKAGETCLHTYSGMFDKLEPQYKKLELGHDQWTHNNKLVLGGHINKSLGTPFYTGKAHGILHNCELYTMALGTEDCKKLAMWPKEDAEFTIVSFARNNGLNGLSKIDLLAAQSTWARLSTLNNTQPTTTNFFDSWINTWLNTRFFAALPETWKRILLETKVKSSVINKTNQVSLESNRTTKIWIPSIIEMGLESTGKTPWNAEGRRIELFKEEGFNDLNKIFTPGCPMVETYADNSAWYYSQDTEPTNAPHGAVWTNGNKHYINYHGFWLKLGGEEGTSNSPYYNSRSVTESYGNFKKWWISGLSSYVSTGTDRKTHVVPCFSI